MFNAFVLLDGGKPESGGKCFTKLIQNVPIAFKDNFCVKSQKTTACSKMLSNFVSPYSATSVDRLISNNCSTIGKTNMDEFAMGSGTLYSPYGPSINPWSDKVKLSTGGSSGGSACAVSLGLAAAALGSDTGGSIRQPAAFCGITGYKPSYGIVSRYGLISMTSSMDTVGILGRCTMDCGLLTDIMGGPDGIDSTCINAETSNDKFFLTQSSLGLKLSKDPSTEEVLEGIEEFSRRVHEQKHLLNGIKIGIPQEFVIKELSPDIIAVWKSCIRDLESAGAEIVSVSIPSLKLSLPAYYVISCAEAASNLSRYDGIRFGLRLNQSDVATSAWGRNEEVHHEILKDLRSAIQEIMRSSSESSMSSFEESLMIDKLLEITRETSTNRGAIHAFMSLTRSLGFGSEVQRRILCGCYVQSREKSKEFFEAAWKVRTMLSREMEQVFSSVHVLLAPTTPTLPFSISEPPSPEEMPIHDVLTIAANLSGCPSVSVACDVINAKRNDVHEKLPVGMQIIGGVLQDDKALKIAAVLEELRRCRVEDGMPASLRNRTG